MLDTIIKDQYKNYEKNYINIFNTIAFGLSIFTRAWTLEACVERALEMNISIKQSQLDYVNSEIEKRELLGIFYQINVGGNHSWNVGLNQNITTGLLENITTQFSSMNLNLNVDLYNGLQNVKETSQSKFIFTSESISA